MMAAEAVTYTFMSENINSFEKIVPAEQLREQEIITPMPEKRPHDPAMVEDLINRINEEERDEEERIKPTLQ